MAKVVTVVLLPTSLYGPGDATDPDSSRVIPALIGKCLDAIGRGERRIVCWGDGSASREFLFVEDCARAIVLAAERFGFRATVELRDGLRRTIDWMRAEGASTQGPVAP